jgi:hypothetical protein
LLVTETHFSSLHLGTLAVRKSDIYQFLSSDCIRNSFLSRCLLTFTKKTMYAAFYDTAYMDFGCADVRKQ